MLERARENRQNLESARTKKADFIKLWEPGAQMIVPAKDCLFAKDKKYTEKGYFSFRMH